MSKSSTQNPAKSADALSKSSKRAAIELSETELNKVAGGKAKTADKALAQMDGYIKG